MATTTTTTSTLGGTSPRVTEVKTTDVSNRGIYWAIGIAIVLLAIVFAMRPIRDTAATSTTGTIMSETVPATTVDRTTPPTQRQ